MSIIEQIKAEVERLEKEIYYDKVKFGEQKVNRGPSSIESAALGILNHFKSYLLSLEEKSEKPVPDDLDKAARKSAVAPFNFEFDEEHLYEYPYLPIAEQKFKEGAKWDREQMMKEAIPCKVFWHDGPLLDYTQEQQDNALERIGAHVGDKVRIIIVKED